MEKLNYFGFPSISKKNNRNYLINNLCIIQKSWFFLKNFK